MRDKSARGVDLSMRGCVLLLVRVLIGLAMVAGVAYCALRFLSPFLPANWREAITVMPRPVEPLLEVARAAVGPKVWGVDVSPLVALVIIVLARCTLDAFLAPPQRDVRPARLRRPRAAPPARAPETYAAVVLPAPAAAALAPAAGGYAHLNPVELMRLIAATKREIDQSTGAARDAALQRAREMQRELARHKHGLAFLAIDVVGSTTMKANNQPVIVEHAFLAFRGWVDGIVKGQRVWKASWTPDGAMCAFPDIEQAVGAACEILRGLPAFNREEHEMDVPFRVRIGVSQGEVLFPDGARMDEVTDQVIDLAGHLQKYAQPDSLLMARRDVEKLRDRKGFQAAHRQVDGHDVLEWTA